MCMCVCACGCVTHRVKRILKCYVVTKLIPYMQEQVHGQDLDN